MRQSRPEGSGVIKKEALSSSRRGLAKKLAVREGFEPSMPFDIHAFQACSFDHSDTSPDIAVLPAKAEGAYLSPARSFIQGATAGLGEAPVRSQAGI